MKYLLPCDCGQPIAVGVSQAGETLICQACGKAVKAPTLRLLRELPPAKDETPATHAAGGRPVDWSGGRGALFSLSLLILVVALPFAAYHLYIWSQIDIPAYEEHLAAHEGDYLDTLTPLTLLEFWNETKSKTLPETLQPDHVSLKDIRDAHLYQGQVGAVIAAISAAGLAASLLSKKSRTPKP